MPDDVEEVKTAPATLEITTTEPILTAEEISKIDKKKVKDIVMKTAAEDLAREERIKSWTPKTMLGKMVKTGKITSMHDALHTGLPIREVEIVDVLVPDMEDEVLDVNMVQRMTDSGRRVKFAITTVVGNKDGYVGVGTAKMKEVGPAIQRSIEVAKMNVIEIKRGCGSWECGCQEPHSFPFAVRGKCSSVEVIFKPAPKGVSLAVSETPKKILHLAGIKDAWCTVTGETRTTLNFALAVYDALNELNRVKVQKKQEVDFKIVQGHIGGMK
jgi:small subunit ribosomal protein S5